MREAFTEVGVSGYLRSQHLESIATMARRTTSSSKTRSTSRAPAPDLLADQPTVSSARRGRKGKADIEPAVTPSPAPEAATDEQELPLGMEEPATKTPARQQRGRKMSPPSEPSLVPSEATGAEPLNDGVPVIDEATATTGEPPADQTNAPAIGSAPSPVQWDAATGSPTFDWPTIEQVAARGGPNQAMAKLLIAAREDGAKSRWPF